MPLINGQKMACEPCIRGHRSTKCTHANERLMVPVRKPGRPLSSCPHPSSRPCACAAVTAAIPRKQKCRCGPSDVAAPAEHKPDQDIASPPAVTPPSPSKFGNAGFRVQKQGAKVVPSRKQSVDISGLQRMDASQINIMPSFKGLSPRLSSTHGPSTPISDISLYGSMAMTPSDSSFSVESSMFSMYPYPTGLMMPPGGQPKPVINGRDGVSTNGTGNAGPETPRSCCGGADGVKSQADTPSPLANLSNATDNAESAVRSCCSSKPSPALQQTKSSPRVMPPPGMPFAPNGIMMPPFQHPMAIANGMYPFFAQPNIFNYPPQFGSYMQPLQPEQWRQFMAAMAFGQNGGAQPFGMAEPSPVQQTPTTPNGSSWTSHQCSCGDTCQCVGCAAHPYNEATQDYVRSAWNLMKEDAQKGHVHANSNGSQLNGSTDSANTTNGEHEDGNIHSSGTTTPSKPNGDGTWSPVAAHTPSDAPSGVSEEQALSASDFFFVSYPFDDTCAGETMSCPCGDDCQCIGCAIHNNSEPVSGAEDETN